MVQETLMIITLVSIWLSLCMSIVTLSGATDFWLAHRPSGWPSPPCRATR